MASACVNSSLAVPPPPPPQVDPGWLGPRVSFSIDLPLSAPPDSSDPPAAVPRCPSDFEFRLEAPAPADMFPADELFADGKLVPLQSPLFPPPTEAEAEAETADAAAPEEVDEAPASASKWRELLGLRKQKKPPPAAAPESSPAEKIVAKPNPRALRRLLRRNPKSQSTSASASAPLLHPSVSLPCLREADQTLTDSGQPDKPPQAESSRVRHVTARSGDVTPAAADSPRLNAAGKVVYQGLGRSSSSPSNLSGGGAGGARAAAKHRGFDRSYSAGGVGVRVAPVLNVPVCTLRGSRRSVSLFGIDKLFGSASSGTPPPVPASAGGKGKSRGKGDKDQNQKA